MLPFDRSFGNVSHNVEGKKNSRSLQSVLITIAPNCLYKKLHATGHRSNNSEYKTLQYSSSSSFFFFCPSSRLEGTIR